MFTFCGPAVWSTLPPGLFDNSLSLTEHFEIKTENTSLQATTNIVRRRCGVSAILAPLYTKCEDLFNLLGRIAATASDSGLLLQTE